MSLFSCVCRLLVHLSTMRGVTACGFALLLSDLLLWLALWAGLVLLECSSSGGLAALWAFGAVKWPLLYSVTWLVADGEPQCVLHRFVTLLCLLPAVFQSGRMLLEPDGSLFPEPGMVLLVLISSTLACVLWEIFLPSDGGMRKVDKKLSARAVLIRVLKYFRPDIFYVIAAFAFLILGVICECEPLNLMYNCKLSHERRSCMSGYICIYHGMLHP